jgi:serine protease Do
MLAPWLVLVTALAPSAPLLPAQRSARSGVPGGTGGAAVAAPARPLCTGEYADDMSVLLPGARDLEQHQPSYTFCIRTSAMYECPFYGPDGALHRKRTRVIAHGTGFAYRRFEEGTVLLTNEHVAEWPAVTDADHSVDGVPTGCRRISDYLKIVDSESDEYERDDIALTRLTADPQLDLAVVKAHVPLPVMPWRIGRSAGLKERNVVSVRGFPLGVFKADNVGKVIAAYDHDSEKDWDHDDFVVDALLSSGNSGSPVFAVSCKTGEFELVGVYHAAYAEGSALNVVVAIDQVRDLMTTLKRPPRKKAPEAPVSLDGESRARLTTLAAASLEPFFPFGTLPAAVRVRADGALVFEILSAAFPLRSQPWLVLEDLPATRPDAFGELGRVWGGNRSGLAAHSRSELDGETQGLVLRILDALRRDGLATFGYRSAEAQADESKDRFEQVSRLQSALRKTTASRGDLVQAVGDLAERLGPKGPHRAASLADVLAAPAEQPATPPASASLASPEEGR